MERIALLMLAAIVVAAVPAQAEKKKVKVTVEVEVEVEVEEITALTELPTTVNSAAQAGSTETEIKKAVGAMKLALVAGKPAKAVGEHFKSQAEKGQSDEGLGDVVKECIDKGNKGEDLVKCVTGEWDKKPKKEKAHPVVVAKPLDAKPEPVKTAEPVVAPPPPVEKKIEAEATGAAKKKKGALKAN